MKAISPRLNHLVRVLAFAEAPVSVNELAKRFGVSRRTIFREIEALDVFLKPYALSVGAKVGEGIYLVGTMSGKDCLREILDEHKAEQPTGRYERRILLALDLLTVCEAQKLYYYASHFKVSEATISHDLDYLEEKLAKNDVSILRKPGHGVTATGSELAVRGAICSILLEIERRDVTFNASVCYPPVKTMECVRQLTQTRYEQHLVWMTEESMEAFEMYIAVVSERIASGYTIESLDAEVSPRFLTIADFFANSLEMRLSIAFSDTERRSLAIYLSALRTSANISKKLDEAANDFLLKSLAYKMIEHFDPELSPVLKLDDRLVEGLALHTQSAIVRIKNNLELNDPLFDGILHSYPEIFEKSKRALEVFQEFSAIIPESEASFLATHFGAAVLRLSEHKTRRFRISAVCAGGIGTSYLMASQIKKHFAFQADVEICGLEDIKLVDWETFDICVSSVPLDGLPIPVVKVQHLLEQSDIDAIKSQIEKLPVRKNQSVLQSGKIPLRLMCESAVGLLSDAAALLAYFEVITIESGCDFDRLASLAGYRFGGLPESGRLIYNDIINRESMSSQVVPSLELILMHARTSGVNHPVFALIVPENGRFTSPSLQHARCCVVMLAPKKVGRDTLNLIGRISSAFVEDSAFLNAVQIGAKDQVYQRLEEILREYLSANVIF